MKNIDIIIVNYNSTKETIKLIESIKGKCIDIKEIFYIVDNSSEDNPKRIEALFFDITMIYNKKNVGYSKAINQALKRGNSQYVAIINPDTIALNGFLDDIITFLENNSDVGVVGPKIYDPDGTIQGSARRFPNFWTSLFGRKSPLTKFFPNNPFTQREFICFNENKNDYYEADWVSGACMIMRRKAIEKVNGFDEHFFLYWEDTDICRRINNDGWKIVYYKKAKVTHFVGKSSSTKPIKSIYHFHYSCYLLFKKYANWPVKAFMPIVLIALSIRCLFAVGINLLYGIKDRKKNDYGRLIQKKDFERIYSRKIKILRVLSRLNIGGPSIHCAILHKGLSKEKYESKLVTGSISKFEGDMSYLIEPKDDFFTIVPELQREINLLKDMTALYKIIRIIINEKPDIVHTHMAKAGALSRIAVWIYNLLLNKKIKTVHTYHGHVLDGYFSPLKSKIFLSIEKMLTKITDAIIAISQTQKWELSEKYKLAFAKKIHIINLGFDLKHLSNYDGKGKLRKSLKIKDDTLLIGIVGRLVPIKNHFLFLDSAKLLKEKCPKKTIRFIIIGDGELRKKLENYATKLGIRDFVIFYGWVKNIKKIYADMDILLLTSNNEGTPVSIIESMASSVPVVTTAVGGIKDLLGKIENNYFNMSDYNICERGILCPKNNPKAIVNGIKYLIENENGERIKKARDFALKNYTDRKLYKKIEDLYSSLI